MGELLRIRVDRPHGGRLLKLFDGDGGGDVRTRADHGPGGDVCAPNSLGHVVPGGGGVNVMVGVVEYGGQGRGVLDKGREVVEVAVLAGVGLVPLVVGVLGRRVLEGGRVGVVVVVGLGRAGVCEGLLVVGHSVKGGGPGLGVFGVAGVWCRPLLGWAGVDVIAGPAKVEVVGGRTVGRLREALEKDRAGGRARQRAVAGGVP